MAIRPELADIAAEQWGLITTAQARAVGGTPQMMANLCNRDVLERLTHGVYRLVGVAPDPLDDLRAAWLATDPGRLAGQRLRDPDPVVVSHRSAASIYDLGDLEADRFEFTRNSRQRSTRTDVRFHRLDLQGQWRVVDGLPVTTVARTIWDLAAAHVDGGHLASVVRDALTKHGVAADELADVLARYARRYGARNGEALLARFLQEAGVAEPAVRAVELATPNAESTKLAQMSKSIQSMQHVLDAHRVALSRWEGMRLDPATIKTITALTEAVQRIQDMPTIDTSAIEAAVAQVPKALGPTLERARKNADAARPAVEAARRLMDSPAAESARRAAERYAQAAGADQRSDEAADDPDTD